jgi:hypothetical protein
MGKVALAVGAHRIAKAFTLGDQACGCASQVPVLGHVYVVLTPTVCTVQLASSADFWVEARPAKQVQDDKHVSMFGNKIRLLVDEGEHLVAWR